MAHALGDLPKISDSFRQGQISFSKVRAMTRVATLETEEYLMMIARQRTPATGPTGAKQAFRILSSSAAITTALCTRAATASGRVSRTSRNSPTRPAIPSPQSGQKISAETFLRCGTKTAKLALISHRKQRFRYGKAKKWTWIWRLKDCSGGNHRPIRQTAQVWTKPGPNDPTGFAIKSTAPLGHKSRAASRNAVTRQKANRLGCLYKNPSA